jgi:hypothetical protein
MASRLEDLLTTGDKQLASLAYEAAIDTYRTALGEAGAAEAGVEARLQAACEARDAARGVVRYREPEPAPVPPQAETAATALELPAEPEVQIPAVPPAPGADSRPVEPPSFQLIENYSPALERPQPSAYVEPKPLSILDSTPAPDGPDQAMIMRIVLAAIIALLVCAAVILAPNKPSRPHGSSGGSDVTIPANRPEHPTV